MHTFPTFKCTFPRSGSSGSDEHDCPKKFQRLVFFFSSRVMPLLSERVRYVRHYPYLSQCIDQDVSSIGCSVRFPPLLFFPPSCVFVPLILPRLSGIHFLELLLIYGAVDELRRFDRTLKAASF